MLPFTNVYFSTKLKTGRIIKGKSLFTWLQTTAFRRLLPLRPCPPCSQCSNTLLNDMWLASLECTLRVETHKISCRRLSGSSSNSSIHSCSHIALTDGAVCPVSGPLQLDTRNMTHLSYFLWFLLPRETSHIPDSNTSSGTYITAPSCAVSLHSLSLVLLELDQF